MKLNILYIAADFGGVHQSLHQALIRTGECETTIYIPLNYRLRNRTYPNYLPDGSRVICSSVASKWDVLFYKRKIRKKLNYILKQDVDWSKIDLIHATTCCVEGAIAYELSKRFSIPYVLAVRNTDVNSYFRYMIFHRWYFHCIMEYSRYVVFLSNAYQERFFKLIPKSVRRMLASKSGIIYNGIISFYLLNRNPVHSLSKSNIRIITVGTISHNKNQLNLIKAIRLLRSEGFPIGYTIVGKGKCGEEKKYLQKIEKEAAYEDWISVLPEQPKERLLELYRQSDFFALCSFHETFGLVYAEALSQGLPILYSENEGFDNVFSEGEVGFHTNPSSAQDIAERLRDLIAKYDEFADRITNLSLLQFDWNDIAKQFLLLYQKKCI